MAFFDGGVGLESHRFRISRAREIGFFEVVRNQGPMLRTCSLRRVWLITAKEEWRGV